MRSIHITIPEPCHENWDKMLPEEQGRFCLSCQKTVVDLTAMSDREVLRFFNTQKNADTCGRFREDQLDRTISVPKERSIGRWRYFFHVLLPAVFAMHRASAQPKTCDVKLPLEPLAITKGVKSNDSNYYRVGGFRTTRIAPLTILEGKVTDEKGQPLPFVSITANGSTINTTTDSNGHYRITITKLDIDLKFSYVGFETMVIEEDRFPDHISTVNVIKSENKDGTIHLIMKDIRMKASVTGLPEVVVKADSYSSTRMGGLRFIITNVTLWGQKKKNGSATPSDLRIYPDPVIAGSNFKVAIKVPAAGEYHLRFIDASGKVMLIWPVSVSAKEQMTEVDGRAFQQPGIYVVQLMDEKGKPLRTGKLLIQH